MADGGRIGFSGGAGVGFAGDPMEGDKYVMGQPNTWKSTGFLWVSLVLLM